MGPAPGEHLQKFVGDTVRFTLADRDGWKPPGRWRALLRTNLGRAEQLRREILEAHTRGLALAGASWRDIPMEEDAAGWRLELPLAETGYFKAKAYLVDPRGWQHWPGGPDTGISVHPDRYRLGNVLYCAFPRMFGRTKVARNTADPKLDQSLKSLDDTGYTVIPPSGKLRDLTAQLPHIFDKLGCRILHLLPVNPPPTTYARFGRFGSPYAAVDLEAIDPALVVFDRRTTGFDQFHELTFETHLRGGRVFLDIVINHTGWGSTLQEKHPEWFLRQPDGTFVSPGAWGVTWEDLVEFKHQNVELWDELANVFLTWCRRGVDGFRCDAGYKVPVAAWQYIVARVQQEYPETIFLLEGLGGAWEITRDLLTEGGMQWAYSELFQNYSGLQVAGYLDHALKQSQRVGLLVHYSETHDNDRLAAKGRAWSLLRNRLCALGSVSGGFGFTCGVEWLATEKIRVHGSTGMAWNQPENIVPELATLNRLLLEHAAFFDGARLTRLSRADSPVYALLRQSRDGHESVLILVNTELERANTLTLDAAALPNAMKCLSRPADLLGQAVPEIKAAGNHVLFSLPPGGAYCLAPTAVPLGSQGEIYRRARAQAAWAIQAMSKLLPIESIGEIDWRKLAGWVETSPAVFLAAVSHVAGAPAGSTSVSGILEQAVAAFTARKVYPRVICWALQDLRRITPVPSGHWLLVLDPYPFRVSLTSDDGGTITNLESAPAAGGHIACFPPRGPADATLRLESYGPERRHVEAAVRFLAEEPAIRQQLPAPTDLVLLTNGRGGMARIAVDLGRVVSKYDCVLGANLHPTIPVDRHVLAKRIRVWINADGFISPLDARNLAEFDAGPPAVWKFVANAGDARTVEVQITASMLDGRNTVVFQFSRPTAAQASGKQLPAGLDVRLTVRIDLEDRNFHWETKRNGGAEYHFSTHTHAVPYAADRPQETATRGLPPQALGEPLFMGFEFTPAPDRHLRVTTDSGCYHLQPEWSENIPHPVEQTRGQTGSGDAFSPGWFELPLLKGAEIALTVTAEKTEDLGVQARKSPFRPTPSDRAVADGGIFEERLLQAVKAFVVRRGPGKSVIAGYPWFLDWGRDTFICARGLLAGGRLEEVGQLLSTFARFEKNGTLPNTIFGEDASNRDTTDAPLWFALVCEELAAIRNEKPPAPTEADLDHVTARYLQEQLEAKRQIPDPAPAARGIPGLYETVVDPSGRTLLKVLESIAHNYVRGTPNGIRMDADSGLIWSPSHFTWMDTNYPACTPREGYPVEIQALWIRLLRQLAREAASSERSRWAGLADKVLASLERWFWLEDKGYYADVLVAKSGAPVARAVVDDALRSNGLLLVSLGLAGGERARRCVEAAQRYLLVPGALRSLAPLPVSRPLPIYGPGGHLLNKPDEPYWGRYEGPEDTRRKPAYHNGTAWTWTFPIFCEALVHAWDFSSESLATAKSYLGSMDRLMDEGCLGQLPEVLDGDAPHVQRGCDAQAWGATEALRVWRLLRARQP